MSHRAHALFVLLTLTAQAARAEKSNQIRPTPSPVTSATLEVGEWVLVPRVVHTRYTDRVQEPGYAPWDYRMTSTGVSLMGERRLLDWLGVGLGIEAYKKLGTITGPSPVSVDEELEAQVDGSAFKLALQVDVRVLHLDADAPLPAPGDLSLYFFARGIGDRFAQTQEDPSYRGDMAELSFEYRAGLAAHIHLLWGVYLAAFGGIDGLVFSGETTDDVAGLPSQTRSTAGNELYPLFGADLLWAPPFLGGGYKDAFSLGAVWALTTEDEAGFGGRTLTVALSYAFHFGGPDADAE